MTIKSLYPNVRPTLSLNFARTKALDTRITFTRASTGTFVGSNGLIQTAASGAARFDHDPSTGESLGLLVEEARTNLLTYSEQLDNAIWTKGNTSITANATTAPDGTTTADTVVATSGLGYKDFYQNFTSSVSPSTPYTFSVFVKANGARYFTVVPYFNGGSYPSWFDLSTGQALSNTTGNTSTITAYPNGWYKCTTTRTSPASGSALFIVRPTDANLEERYTGTGAACLYLWGAQLEAGSFPTSYIPTTTATVTRAADVASMTGGNFSSWYNQSQGTLFGSFKTSNTDVNMGLFAAYQNSAPFTNRISLRPRASFADNGGALQFVFYATVPTSQQTKMAWGFGSTATLYKDGVSIGTDSSVSLSSALDSAGIGVIESLNGWINGTIARLAYYPVRLPDAQLQALTS